ncbi:DUF5939 domain-containing protein [Paenibacillus lutrae]|uniref:Guanylate cyclase domain-containing protein n=1 Tax=Paenibacillus lutrae TaxID=2078573 RepID=A0A7X3JZX9_9BACL|nr:DUF5939 domain-containing protein [Paenibacillus lutrae]MVP00396.1 hypothetical protein [Paenibacillus lutrae]
MYFPPLIRLGSYNINPFAIGLLDSWLAVQRQAVLSNLSPIRFSDQSDIDVELAIDMFSLSAQQDIGVLKAIYKCICPNCDGQNGKYNALSSLPKQDIICRYCGYNYSPNQRLDYVEIVFERCLEPSESVTSTRERDKFSNSGVINLGNAESLRVQDIIDKPNKARRHLLNNLDSRYEAAQ